jgi:predicted DNA-binding transcriptional regulator YafY
MDRTERFYRIDQLLNQRRAVPLAVFLDELGVSRATFKRDLEYLRDRLHAPIVWDREAGGYRFGVADSAARQYELPGLWFNATEVHALLTMQHLLENLQPGLLGPHVAPLLARIRALMDEGDHAPEEVERRIRILHMGARRVPPRHFEAVSSALLSRKRLAISHYSRGNDQVTEREVSPQRVVFYRDNWYLDAWCHLRRGLRSFSMDTIRRAVVIDRAARPVAERLLDEQLASGYGIFSGARTRTARLRFTPERARWVADEVWHPKQVGSYDGEGFWLLEFPYSDDRELLLDVLKHGAHVEVLGPRELRAKVRRAHLEAVALYQHS